MHLLFVNGYIYRGGPLGTIKTLELLVFLDYKDFQTSFKVFVLLLALELIYERLES